MAGRFVSAPTLDQTLAKAVAARGACTAIVTTDGESVSYAAFAGMVERLANSFAGLGVRPGDRVGIYLPKHLLACVLPYAAAACGAVFVPINAAMKSAQVAHVLRDAGVVMLLTSPQRLLGLREVVAAAPGLRSVLLTEPAADIPDIPQCVHWWQALPEAVGGDVCIADGASHEAPEQLAALLYTSGSTGMSKGVMVTHRNLIVGCESVCEYLRLSADDVLLAALPFSFDYGFNQLVSALSVGATCVLHDFYLPQDLIAAIERHQVTGLAGVPTLWTQIAKAWGTRAPNRRLRYFTNSGGALRQRVLDDLQRVFPAAAPYLMYGLTEAFRSTYLPPELVSLRKGSIGKAIPGAEILVIKDDLTPAGHGESGELVHCGELVTLGYWNAPEATAQRFRPVPGRVAADGSPEIGVWSGDIVSLDADGFLYFVGRRDGLIKTSGYRVSPDEVEEVVSRMSGVVECCAFGVPDDVLGEKIMLAVVADVQGPVTGAALSRWCAENLPNYMLPSEIMLCDFIPRNMNGKLDRVALLADNAAAAAAVVTP